jgi:hypothetical protein
MDSISALLPPVCSSIYPPSPASLEARGGRKIKSLQGTLELQWAFSQVWATWVMFWPSSQGALIELEDLCQEPPMLDLLEHQLQKMLKRISELIGNKMSCLPLKVFQRCVMWECLKSHLSIRSSPVACGETWSSHNKLYLIVVILSVRSTSNISNFWCRINKVDFWLVSLLSFPRPSSIYF